YAQRLPALDLEADIPQRPKFLDRVADDDGAAARQVRRLAPESVRPADQRVPQGDIPFALSGMADQIFLAEPLGADDDVLHHVRSDRRSAALWGENIGCRATETVQRGRD